LIEPPHSVVQKNEPPHSVVQKNEPPHSVDNAIVSKNPMPVAPVIQPSPANVVPATDGPSVAALCHNGVAATTNQSTAQSGGPFVPINISANLDSEKPLRAIVFSPDRKKFATAGDDGVIWLWDSSSFKLIKIFAPRNGRINSIAFSPDGTKLASAGWDNTVRLWNVASGASLHVFDDIKQKAYSVSFASDKHTTYLLAGFAEGHIGIWDLRTYQLEQQPSDTVAKPVWSLSTAPDQSGDYVSGHFGTVWFHYLKMKTSPVPAHAGATFHVEYSADGGRVLSAGYDGKVNIWSRIGEKLKPISTELKYLIDATWSPDGHRVLAVGQSSAIQLWDVDKLQKLHAYGQGEEKDVEAAAFHTRANRFITVGENKLIKVWDINDEQRPLLTLIGFNDGEYVTYSSAGCYDASPGAGQHFKVTVDGSDKNVTPKLLKDLFTPEGFSSVLIGN
jgi:WD40 repeat protein